MLGEQKKEEIGGWLVSMHGKGNDMLLKDGQKNHELWGVFTNIQM